MMDANANNDAGRVSPEKVPGVGRVGIEMTKQKPSSLTESFTTRCDNKSYSEQQDGRGKRGFTFKLSPPTTTLVSPREMNALSDGTPIQLFSERKQSHSTQDDTLQTVDCTTKSPGLQSIELSTPSTNNNDGRTKNTEHVALLNRFFHGSKNDSDGIHANEHEASLRHCWSYSGPGVIDWNILSQNLLTVTYTRAEHAIPEYTNVNSCLDYMSRFLLGTIDSSTFANSAEIFSTLERSSNNDNKGQRGICPSLSSCTTKRKKDVYQEVYTHQDIRKVDILEDGVQIRGWKGQCQAIQVHLVSKHDPTRRRYSDGESDRTPTTISSDMSGSSSSSKSTTRFNIGITMEEESKSSRRSLNFKKKRLQALNEQYERSTSQQQSATTRIFEEKNDNMPIPPWCKDCETNDNAVQDEEDGEAQLHGPILTFAIPDMLENNNYDGVLSEKDIKTNLLRDSPPLLWKVEFPPDPSISLETLTVLDGMLDVASTELSGGKVTTSDQDETDAASYSSSSESPLGFDGNDVANLPTNIYINGYQSWSYAGSVQKGEEQPTSAMPNFLSKAFNLGGTVPPQPTCNVIRGKEQTRNPKSDLYPLTDGPTYDYLHRSDGKSFHDMAFYKSSFFTCISSNNQDGNEIISTRHAVKTDEIGGPALVLGFLSQHKQYGLITFDSKLQRVAMHASLHGVIASSSNISTDWAYCQFVPSHCYDEEPMVHYINAVAAYNKAKPLQKFPQFGATGWCSWYHYYENIDSETLCINFERLNHLKTQITSDVSIIDDGYITAWGDWASLKAKQFPDPRSMKTLAENIEMNGMKAGLWMAPYACDKQSLLAKEHPDWIIKNDEGRIANSSNCGKFFYGLDATNPEVREYAFRSVRRAVKEWGYKLLKLDFLYAACLAGNGKYDLSMSRAETMYLALKTLRDAAGDDTFLIGCGCPLGPAVGLMDAMRISADTGPTWVPEFPLPWWDHSTLPSLRAMIRNSTTRACLGHRWWHNDPDCVLLGETTSLTDNDVISAATVVAMTGGMLLLSDDLSQLSADRLSVVTRINPVTGVTGVVLDLHHNENGLPSLIRAWCTDRHENSTVSAQSKKAIDQAADNSKLASFSPEKPWSHPSARIRNCIPVAKGLGTWSVVSMSNWLDKDHIVSVPIASLLPPACSEDLSTCEKSLNLGYHVFAFWSQKYMWVSGSKFDSNKALSKKLGEHESEIFHVKPVIETPQYIGSDLHFTCGYEVLNFSCSGKTIDLRLKNDAKRDGFVYLYIPTEGNMINAQINDMRTRVEIIARTPRQNGNKIVYSGKVVRIWISIKGDASSNDGRILVTYS